MKKLILILACCIGTASANDFVGKWQTVDDETGKVRSVVELKEVNGKLSGWIVAITDPNKQNEVCSECKGKLNDQPIIGLQIMSGYKKKGKGYEDGEIVDPDSGKVYSSKLKLIKGGSKLEVRGFIGFSFIGRTQTWIRQ